MHGKALVRRWPCLLLALALWFAFALPLAVAQEPIRVVANEHTSKFSAALTFTLRVESANPIEQVTLYHRRAGAGLTIKTRLPVERGQQTYTYTRDLEPGDIPVGARIEYYWDVTDVAGNTLRTPVVGFTYADTRFDWQTLQRGLIDLHHYGRDQEQAESLLDAAMDDLMRLQQEMGVQVSDRVQIWVYESKADMALALPAHSATFDDRTVTLGVKVDKSTLLILGSHADVEATMAHELSHIVVGLAADSPFASMPRWLDEGLAMYAEGELSAGHRRALDQAIRQDRLISVRSLSGYTGDPSQVDLFYAEVYSLIEYLLDEYGADRMSDLIVAIREGLGQEAALQQVYDLDLDGLDAAWRVSLGLTPRTAPPEAAATPPPSPAAPSGRRGLACRNPLALLLGLGVVVIVERRRAGAA